MSDASAATLTEIAPSVAVVVINYNGGAFLGQFADSYRAVTYEYKRLWLVDSASTDGSERLLPELFPDAEILYTQRNAGFGAAVNLALRSCLATNPDFVLLLNPDSLVAPDFLQHLVETADGRTMAGPKVLSSATGRLATYAGPFNWFHGRSFDTHWDEPADAAFIHTQEVEEAGFVCMLIPAAVFRMIGDFDERFGMYCEDTDFCIRARKAGYRIVIQPQAIIRHIGQASSGNNGNEFFYYYATRNRLFVLWMHGGTLRRFAYIGGYLAFFLDGLFRLMLHRRWRMCRVWLTALRDGLSGRTGMTYGPRDFVEPMPLIRRRQGTV